MVDISSEGYWPKVFLMSTFNFDETNIVLLLCMLTFSIQDIHLMPLMDSIMVNMLNLEEVNVTLDLSVILHVNRL